MKPKKVIFVLALIAAKAIQLAHADSGEWIIGGTEVAPSDPIARSTVALLIGGSSLCTGSLIDSDLIVTAAHCLADNPSSIEIFFSTQVNRQSLKTALPANRYVVNPAYRTDKAGPDQNDIALIEFHGGLPAGYQPNRLLSDERLLRNEQEIQLAGYGISNASQQTGAGILRQTEVQIADESFGKTEILLFQTEGSGACHGDSGGPAFLKVGSSLYLWGVTSRAYPNSAPDDCAHESVYTKIMDHMSFIQSSLPELRS
jgi:secreted trypsin-like serine protease